MVEIDNCHAKLVAQCEGERRRNNKLAPALTAAAFVVCGIEAILRLGVCLAGSEVPGGLTYGIAAGTSAVALVFLPRLTGHASVVTLVSVAFALTVLGLVLLFVDPVRFGLGWHNDEAGLVIRDIAATAVVLLVTYVSVMQHPIMQNVAVIVVSMVWSLVGGAWVVALAVKSAFGATIGVEGFTLILVWLVWGFGMVAVSFRWKPWASQHWVARLARLVAAAAGGVVALITTPHPSTCAVAGLAGTLVLARASWRRRWRSRLPRDLQSAVPGTLEFKQLLLGECVER